MEKERQLTDKQKAFLEHLFNDAEGDYKKAKALAGYADSVPTSEIARSLSSEILELARMHLTLHAPAASQKMTKLLYNPTEASAMNTMKIASNILDRVGVSAPKEDVNLKIPSGGLFIMPAKERAKETEKDTDNEEE